MTDQTPQHPYTERQGLVEPARPQRGVDVMANDSAGTRPLSGVAGVNTPP